MRIPMKEPEGTFVVRDSSKPCQCKTIKQQVVHIVIDVVCIFVLLAIRREISPIDKQPTQTEISHQQQTPESLNFNPLMDTRA